MNTIYLVVLEDRHTGIKIEAFTTQQAAHDRAGKISLDYKLFEWDHGMMRGDCTFAVRLSSEGDFISVLRAEVQQ